MTLLIWLLTESLSPCANNLVIDGKKVLENAGAIATAIITTLFTSCNAENFPSTISAFPICVIPWIKLCWSIIFKIGNSPTIKINGIETEKNSLTNVVVEIWIWTSSFAILKSNPLLNLL